MCSLLTNTNTRLLSCMTCTDTLLTVPTDTLCPYQRTLSVRTTGHSQSVRTYEQTLLVPTNKHCPHLRTNTVRTDEQPLSAQTMRGSRIEPAFTNSAVLLERFKLFRSLLSVFQTAAWTWPSFDKQRTIGSKGEVGDQTQLRRKHPGTTK